MLLPFQSVFDKLELRMLQWIIRAEATAGAAAGADMMMIGADRRIGKLNKKELVKTKRPCRNPS